MTPRTRSVAHALVAASIALAWPAVARAQWSTRDVRDGLEVAVYAGYGALSNGGAFRASGTTGRGLLLGSLGLQFEAGYRFVPAFSAGLHGTFQIFAVNTRAIPTGTDASANGGALGPYLRFHPLALIPGREVDRDDALGRADVYLGIGFDFLATVGGSSRTSSVFGALTTSTTTAGVAMPIVLGVEYRVHPNVFVGLMGEWSYWTASTACASLGAGSSTVCNSDPHDAEGYLFVGAGVRGHFSLLH